MVVRRSEVTESEVGGRLWEWWVWKVCKSQVSMSPSSKRMRAASGRKELLWTDITIPLIE
jgi:hypothetical protein